jgi:hypothetical protein
MDLSYPTVISYLLQTKALVKPRFTEAIALFHLRNFVGLLQLTARLQPGFSLAIDDTRVHQYCDNEGKGKHICEPARV